LGCQNNPPDPQNGCNDGLIQIGSTCQPKKEKWWECDVPWYMTCDSQAKKKDDSRDTTKVIQKTTVINSATAAATATTTPTSAEVSSCRLDGSADGILQKFDTVKYQVCGLYIDGQKAYSDGFVAGCTQVGNTQLICQSFIESSIFNTKIQTTQTSTQNPHAAAQSTEQGITPITVDK
jgi:hypothetical protein